VTPDAVLKDLAEYFRTYPRGADVITFSSAGEPTLYRPLGELIKAIKRGFPSLPLVVITNGSLLWDAEVRKELQAADEVIPSMDAVAADVFKRVNSPHPSLDLAAILEGLRAFRMEYRGRLRIEVLLASGYNDQPEHLLQFYDVIEQLAPDAVELNTVVRPPAKPGVRGLTEMEMKSVLQFFPAEKTSIVGSYCGCADAIRNSDLAGRVVEMVLRRPCTLPEMVASLGVDAGELTAALTALEEKKQLVRSFFDGREYICRSPRSNVRS
jgi:wyosine [tRNA(Phe)-imidazoG37] synthetase (radical SAM superfamily)